MRWTTIREKIDGRTVFMLLFAMPLFEIGFLYACLPDNVVIEEFVAADPGQNPAPSLNNGNDRQPPLPNGTDSKERYLFAPGQFRSL
jgi:hypothetical protein